MPRLGDDTYGSSAFPGSSDRCLVTKFTATEAGTITGVGAYITVNYGNDTIKVVVLDDDGGSGEPGTLLYASPDISTTTEGWYTASLSGSFTAKDYWIGIVASGGCNYGRDDGLSGMNTRMANGTFSRSSPPSTWPGTDASYDTSRMNVYLEYTAGSTLDQTHFRWRNDDGSETTATWAAAEDTNVTIAALTPKRLRVEITATGDPASAAYKLQYRKVGDSTWRDIN